MSGFVAVLHIVLGFCSVESYPINSKHIWSEENTNLSLSFVTVSLYLSSENLLSNHFSKFDLEKFLFPKSNSLPFSVCLSLSFPFWHASCYRTACMSLSCSSTPSVTTNSSLIPPSFSSSTRKIYLLRRSRNHLWPSVSLNIQVCVTPGDNWAWRVRKQEAKKWPCNNRVTMRSNTFNMLWKLYGAMKVCGH